MPPTDLCGATTQSGGYCRNDAARCPQHSDTPALPNADTQPHDLRALGWSLLDRLANGELDPRRAGVMASLMRVVAALGPEPEDEQELLREAQLRGLVMHGIPPRTPEEWQLAERVFDDEALREFHRWESLGRGG